MRQLLILAAISALFAGCGTPAEHGLSPQEYQKQYCEANHWTYEPGTNACKVKEKH